MTRVRADRRSVNTRAAIIDAAEHMFGESGLDGVSLRGIAAEIGAGNTNVVAYHFGDKDALVEAIFMHRVPALDARRAQLLEVADAVGDGDDLLTLLDVLYRPFYEQKNKEGYHSYARFLMSVFRSNRFDMRDALNEKFPATQDVIERIRACCEWPAKKSSPRMSLSLPMLCSALIMIDARGLRGAQAEAIYADALAMIEAGLRAPAPKLRPKGRK